MHIRHNVVSLHSQLIFLLIMSRIRVMSIFLIIAGVIMIVIGLYIYLSHPQSSSEEQNVGYKETSTTLQAETPKPVFQHETQHEMPRPDNEDSLVKGKAFEKYVVSKFSKKYWKIHDWRGDKNLGDRYAETSQDPDLEMKLSFKGKEYIIAVECKWRRTADSNSTIKWSYPDQLERYRKFQKDKKMPVFVAIGVGGQPSSPDQLYIIPLDKMSGLSIKLDNYSSYSHDLNKNLFYDTETGKLL